MHYLENINSAFKAVKHKSNDRLAHALKKAYKVPKYLVNRNEKWA